MLPHIFASLILGSLMGVSAALSGQPWYQVFLSFEMAGFLGLITSATLQVLRHN